jgi:hypothetical protein
MPEGLAHVSISVLSATEIVSMVVQSSGNLQPATFLVIW